MLWRKKLERLLLATGEKHSRAETNPKMFANDKHSSLLLIFLHYS